jgi:hypothetical protein
LQDSRLIDWSRTMEGTALDPVLRTLPACPRLRKVLVMNRCAIIGAMRVLLQLTKDTHLTLETDHWLAVADEIRQGRCNIKHLPLPKQIQGSSFKAIEAVEAIGSGVRLNCNLEYE